MTNPTVGCRLSDFQGFRVIQVKNDVIDRMHYIRLAELRANNFKMPWEPPIPLPPLGGKQGSLPSTTKTK